jgi:hypothetical protein
MKKLVYLAITTLFFTACITSKNKIQERNLESETVVLDSTFLNLERVNDMSVSINLPGDPEIPRNYETDTSYYNVFNVIYKITGLTQVLVLPQNWSVNDIVSIENLFKIDTLQIKVRLIDVH